MASSTEHKCCGVVHEAASVAREKRERRHAKKQPWIVLKLALFISVALLIYTAYVYIGRLCVPMLMEYSDALGSRTYGIAFIVVFGLLFIMTCWSYAMVAFTSPGFARDHVSETPRSAAQPWNSNLELEGTPYEHHVENSAEEPSPQTTTSLDPKRPTPRYSRRPPQTPVLLPEHRYCGREGIVKPFRTHHCRACGACVLKYDHHCPWIGQCVGARNQKFFVIFVLWTFVYCLWVLTTLIGMNVRPRHAPNTDIDPQHIVTMALTGFFGLFTGTMFVTHVRMISLNITTVEQIRIMNMKDHESMLLGEMFAWWQIRLKGQTKREWDEEWGDLNTEGNIWWLGSKRRNWESVMGTNVWWWFLPIGRPESDGLDYPTNPRFDTDGRWRRRRDWPVELR